MNLQEFLKANPEAEAEYNANLLSAEEKGKAENVEKERARIVNILKHAGAKVAENVIEALDGGMDDNQFAVEELNRQKENKSVVNKQVFASLESVPQTPAEQDPQTVTEVKPEEIRAKVKNVLDSIGGI